MAERERDLGPQAARRRDRERGRRRLTGATIGVAAIAATATGGIAWHAAAQAPSGASTGTSTDTTTDTTTGSSADGGATGGTTSTDPGWADSSGTDTLQSGTMPQSGGSDGQHTTSGGS